MTATGIAPLVLLRELQGSGSGMAPATLAEPPGAAELPDRVAGEPDRRLRGHPPRPRPGAAARGGIPEPR